MNRINRMKPQIIVGAVMAVAAVGALLVIRTDKTPDESDERLREQGPKDPTQGVQAVENLTQAPAERRDLPYSDEKGKASWFKRNRHFATIWLARDQRDVTRDIARFLQDPHVSLRVRAARALGRLEEPAAEALLRAALQHQKVAKSKQAEAEFIPEVTLKLALGRIGAHSLKGEAKVQAVVQSVGLTFNDVVRLSQKVNIAPSHGEGSIGAEIVQEFVDLLYAMGKKGKDIKPFATRLKLNPSQHIMILAAPLSFKDEIDLIVNHLSQIKVLGMDEQVLSNHLLGLGRSASDAIIRRLEEMQREPSRYREQAGWIAMFRAAVAAGDRRAVPVLRHVEKQKGVGSVLGSLASMSRREVQGDLWFPPNFPA